MTEIYPASTANSVSHQVNRQKAENDGPKYYSEYNQPRPKTAFRLLLLVVSHFLTSAKLVRLEDSI
jgi:hypothetical protein